MTSWGCLHLNLGAQQTLTPPRQSEDHLMSAKACTEARRRWFTDAGTVLFLRALTSCVFLGGGHKLGPAALQTEPWGKWRGAESCPVRRRQGMVVYYSNSWYCNTRAHFIAMSQGLISGPQRQEKIMGSKGMEKSPGPSQRTGHF